MKYLTGIDPEPLYARACAVQLEKPTPCNKEPFCHNQRKHVGCNKKKHGQKIFLIKKIKHIKNPYYSVNDNLI